MNDLGSLFVIIGLWFIALALIVSEIIGAWWLWLIAPTLCSFVYYVSERTDIEDRWTLFLVKRGHRHLLCIPRRRIAEFVRRAPHRGCSLRPEIDQWCRENLSGRVGATHGSFPLREIAVDWYGRDILWFDDEGDAVLFSLRWL